MFSMASLGGLFSFGWKLSLTSLIDTLYNNVYGLLIGKMYTKEDLSFVNKGRHLPELLMQTIATTLSRVAFPVMSQVQDDDSRICSMMSKILKISSFTIFPILAFCAVSAKPITIILFGEQWLPIVPYIQLSCVMYAFSPFNVLNLQVLLSKGRSDLYLKLEVLKKVIGVILVIVSVQFSPLCLIASMALILYPLCAVINIWPIGKLIGYGFRKQIKDVIASIVLTAVLIVCSCVMSIVCRRLNVGSIYLSSIIALASSAFVGFGAYATVAFATRVEPFKLLCDIVQRKR